MKRVGIDFADNDFAITTRAFVQMLLNAYQNDPEKIESFDKYNIVLMFNEMSWGLYTLFQDRDFPYNNVDWETVDRNERRTRQYLTIEKKDVFFDEEVDDYFLNQTWRHNSHFFWADFETGQVFWC